MSNFDEVRFPENIDFGFTGGAMYSTDIVELFSGFEQRNQNWAASRMKFVASYSIKNTAEIAQIIAFFRARKGRTTGFRFRDWTDYYAYDQQIAVGDGTTSIFQLIKTYISGPTTDTRIITKIVASGNEVTTVPNIYLNSILQNSGYMLDYTTGLVTFTTPPASGVIISADFEFDVPVRFDIDNIQIRHEYNKEFYIDNMTLIEVRI